MMTREDSDDGVFLFFLTSPVKRATLHMADKFREDHPPNGEAPG